ncbi:MULTISPECIES: hypothetical protein [Sorangium]
MSTSPLSAPTPAVPYIIRVLTAEATKKGTATAVAGLLVAAISEAICPSS